MNPDLLQHTPDLPQYFRKWTALFVREAGFGPGGGEGGSCALGYLERGSGAGAAVLTNYRRLHASARVLFVFSRAAQLLPEYRRYAAGFFNFLLLHRREKYSFVYQVTPEGEHLDSSLDAYGHAFVLFALASYYQLTADTTVLELIRQVDLAIEEIFFNGEFYRMRLTPDLQETNGGLSQNHHMHFFEAFLELFRVTQDEFFLRRAQRTLAICEKFFLVKGTVLEFSPVKNELGSKAAHIEPGHVCEWAGLLSQYSSLTGSAAALPQAQEMLTWAFRYGWDEVYGGMYNELDVDAKVKNPQKRLWPLTEAMRACVLLRRLTGENEYQKYLAVSEKVFYEHYFRSDGSWEEHLTRELKPCGGEMPVTTLYHLLQYFLAPS